jgi:hypothetical protein
MKQLRLVYLLLTTSCFPSSDADIINETSIQSSPTLNPSRRRRTIKTPNSPKEKINLPIYDESATYFTPIISTMLPDEWERILSIDEKFLMSRVWLTPDDGPDTLSAALYLLGVDMFDSSEHDAYNAAEEIEHILEKHRETLEMPDAWVKVEKALWVIREHLTERYELEE